MPVEREITSLLPHLRKPLPKNYVRLCTPLPMWILWRHTKTLHMRDSSCDEIPKTNFRSHAGSHRHSHIVPMFLGIEVPRVDYEELSGERAGESSEAIRSRVQSARDIQRKRLSDKKSAEVVCNANMRVGSYGSSASYRMKVRA